MAYARFTLRLSKPAARLGSTTVDRFPFLEIHAIPLYVEVKLENVGERSMVIVTFGNAIDPHKAAMFAFQRHTQQVTQVRQAGVNM